MHENRLKEDSDGLIDRAEILERWSIRNKKVLDLGAGPLAVIAARDFNCTVTNIDIADEALRERKREAEEEGVAERITFEHEDVTQLSYPSKSFDVVICYGILHHIELDRRMNVIQGAYRIAKEMVIVVEFTPEGFKSFHADTDFTVVDIDWLEKELNSLGKVDKYSGTMMNVYTLFLLPKENLS
jgi:ubiquinone/menaquinone biosynthesis C-methylase UbiE